MEQRRSRAWIYITLSLLLGLAIGLFVGWVIWPVEWINASPENLEASFQSDYANMMIDSYSVNGNQQLAYQRYAALGDSGPEALGGVIENPVWVTQAQVDEFTQAMLDEGGEEALGVQPAESTQPNYLRPPLLYYLMAVILLGLLAIVLLSTALVRALRPREVVAPVAAIESATPTDTEGLGSSAVVAAATTEERVETPVEVVESAPEEDTQPVQVAAATEVAAVADEAEIGEGGGGLTSVAVAAGAAALVDAAVAGEHDEEAAPEGLTEAGDGAAAIAAAGLAAAAAQDEALEEEGAVDAPQESAPATGVEWALEEEAASVEGETGEAAVPETPAGEWIPDEAVQEQAPDYYGKYNRKLIEVEGIGPVYAEKLAAVGLTMTQAFLQSCATPKGRQQLAESTGITGKLILEWANHIDLMRIQGIGPQWSDLLEAAGIDTVRELATRNPVNLHTRMVEINEEKSLVRQLPTQAQIEDWVEQAKDLPRILNY